MAAQVPFHRWGGEGVPLPVRQQLFNIGSGAACCVVCGQAGHGIHNCSVAHLPEGQALAAAWDKKWLLLLGKELISYALCPNDAEYIRRSAAMSAKSVVDRAAVIAFQREHAIQSTSPGYGGSFGKPTARQFTANHPASVAQPAAALRSSAAAMPKRKPKPKPVPKTPASNPAVAAPAAPKPRKRGGKRKNRRQREVVQAASTQAYGLQAAEMEVDATSPSSIVAAVQSPPHSVIRTSASPRIQALRTSRSTAMTPPPIPPLLPAGDHLVPVSSPLLPSPASSPPRAAGQLLPHPAPLLPSPGTAFRSIAVGSSSGSTEVSQTDGRQSRSTEPCDGKNIRSISASALVPIGKSVRSSDDVCIPTAAQRGSVTVGSMSTAVVVHSQPSQPSQRPYQLWSLERYLAATSSSRRLFWQRATEDKRWGIAAALSNMPERTAVQEARQDFGAERWGLKPGGGGAAELADEDDEYL